MCREHKVIRFGGFADLLDAFQILSDVAGGDQLPELVLAAHVEGDEGAALTVGSYVYIPPAQVAGLHRPHAGVGHDEDEVIGHCPVPAIIGVPVGNGKNRTLRFYKSLILIVILLS